nr:deubiquitinating protein VCPIP1 [Parasteatoda tepidariorum]
MSELSLLKFICKDSMCRNVIPVGPSEISVVCWECGIKYDQNFLQDAVPVYNYDEIKMTFFRRCIAHFLPKRGADLVKVNGLSNYYCKLLSPFLTNYGMDQATGQVKLLIEMNKGDILDCSIFKDRAFLIHPDQLSITGFGRDISGSMNYLSATLNIIKESNDGEERLVPIYTDGDGHCLVHAISRALLGRELFWHPLRCCLKKHFENNLNNYQELFKDFVEPEDWRAIIEESDPEFKPPEGELHGLRNVHIFGLANVLKRPIILLDSLECMKKCGDYSALFLPGFIPPEDCRGKDNTLNKPICIAWSSFSHNHYIPLVGVQKRPLPVLPRSLIPKVWGMPQTEFENYIELDNKGNCVIAGDRILSENYIQRLVKAMETLFLEKKGVHPLLVADAKLYICSEPAYLNVKVETMIEHTKIAAERGYLYQCLYCKAMCKFQPTPSLFCSGSVIHSLLFETYTNFDADTSYKVPGTDHSCKYDPVKNEFYPDVTVMSLPKCTVCNSSNVQRLKPNDTIVGLPGDQSYTNTSSSVSSQENKSLVDKILKSQTVSSQENRLFLNTMLNSGTNPDSKLLKREPKNDSAANKYSELLVLDLEWKGKTAQYSISPSNFKELGSSIQDCISILAKNIAAQYFPSESQNVEFDMYVSDMIYNQVSKLPADALKSPVTSEKNEKEIMAEESSSGYVDTVVSEPQFVKVVTSKGQQGNLTLHKDGISYFQLQEWIVTEFKIPAKNQKIKWGFPPKELELPNDVYTQNLPLKHGDRLIVENVSLSVSEKKNYLNSAPHNSTFDYQNLADSTQKFSSDIMWRVYVHEPDLFKKGGSMFKTAADKHILCDKDHITLPCFPTKRFCYNASTESLELCVKALGHFQICGDIDDRIECVRRGQFVPGFKRCPQMGGPSKETVVARPFRKPITSSPEEDRPYFRKGPGFSVLSKPSEKMDFS